MVSCYLRYGVVSRDVRILKFLSQHQSADFDQESAVSLRPQQKTNIVSASVYVYTE